MARVHTRFRYLVELWRSYAAEPEPHQLDRWLAGRFKQMRQLGRRDRIWYGNLMFASMRLAVYAAAAERWQDSGDVALAEVVTLPPDAIWQLVRAQAPERLVTQVIATLAQRGQLATIAGDEAAALAALAAPALPALAELDAALTEESSTAAACLAAGVPGWFGAHLEARAARTADFDARAFLALLASRPPLWLRVLDPARTPKLADELAQLFDEVTTHGADAIRLRGAAAVATSSAYEQGRVEIQDLASQAIGAAVAPRPDELIWDACAGGGGKTVQLAALATGRGRIYASDLRRYKLDEVRKRAARAGLDHVAILPWSGSGMPKLPAEVRRQGGFDQVLVDAPCSAAGTWRRAPDARFRLSDAQLAELTALQGQILSDAASCVRPGGRLVYATCSWLVAENEMVAEAFTAAHPAWRLLSCQLHGAPWLDSDTTFTAVMQR